MDDPRRNGPDKVGSTRTLHCCVYSMYILYSCVNCWITCNLRWGISLLFASRRPLYLRIIITSCRVHYTRFLTRRRETARLYGIPVRGERTKKKKNMKNPSSPRLRPQNNAKCSYDVYNHIHISACNCASAHSLYDHNIYLLSYWYAWYAAAVAINSIWHSG